jgi:predicted DNA-binding transcriptional regulator YafY
MASILTNRPLYGLFLAVNRASTIDRLQRLELITTRLKSDDSLVIGDLAKEFGVSVRTLTRDIQILRNQGLPIDADRGRGGGVRMHWSWGIGRLALSYAEAVDLLVSLAVAEQIRSPLLMANLGSVRRKLMASFSPSMRRKINGLKSRIIVGESASPFVLSAFSVPDARVVERLHQAFLMMRKIHIHYRDASGEKTERAIEPQYLLLSYPVWYAIAWDDLRSEVRTFRCDRIERARLLDDAFRPRRFTEVEAAVEAIDAT